MDQKLKPAAEESLSGFSLQEISHLEKGESRCWAGALAASWVQARAGIWGGLGCGSGLPGSTSDQQCDLPSVTLSFPTCKQDGWLRGADEITRMTVWRTACSFSGPSPHAPLRPWKTLSSFLLRGL